MRRKMKAPETTLNIPDWMIIDSIRYAVGRRTYQVAVTCAWIKSNWHLIDDKIKAIIKQDLEWEFKAAERTGNYSHLGDTCDRIEWEQVRALWGETVIVR